MHSSISSSKNEYFGRVILFLLLISSLYLLFTIAGFKFYEEESLNDTNNIPGKADLMMSTFSGDKPDIVFIGSSTTKYHISTNVFKKNKIKVFNYGIESHFFTVYPSMIDHAIKLKPKIIALSLYLPELYISLVGVEGAFNKDVHITYNNLGFFISHYLKHIKEQDERNLISRLIKMYFAQYDFFFMKGYKISSFIQDFYNKFNHVEQPVQQVSAPNVKTVNIYEKYLDCTPIGIASTGMACTNGDGIITAIEKNLDYETYNRTSKLNDKKYNYTLIDLYNRMLDKIRKANIKPVVILIPQFENYIGNTDLIKKTIHAEVINMNQLRLPKDAWFNGGHLNAKGRYVYSEALAKTMKQMV